jgi:hypothetical protein
MKRLIIVLICGFLLAPLSAFGQKWIEPYTDKNGNQVEGHWQTSEDLRNDKYSAPGQINPYTGQFNPYTGSGQRLLPTNPTLPTPNPYYPQQDYRYQQKDYRYQNR